MEVGEAVVSLVGLFAQDVGAGATTGSEKDVVVAFAVGVAPVSVEVRWACIGGSTPTSRVFHIMGPVDEPAVVIANNSDHTTLM